MNNKEKKIYFSWTAYVNDRMDALNIGNVAWKYGMDGSIMRESQCCSDVPIDMWCVRMYGRVLPATRDAVMTYVKAKNPCSFTIDHDDE